ncbi:MAG: hypothetical protein HY273_05645 [Gammaproteobacteria bacterium]|nr:hypothetical protein [Gammaproteobacteria bacterium]
MPRTFLSLLLTALLLTGCATTYVVRVDSIAESGAPAAGIKYVMTSGMNDVKDSDLYFREFAAQFHRILTAKGYVETSSRTDANILITLSYGTSSGHNEVYSYLRPLYHVSGGENITYKEVKTDASGQKTETYSTVYVPLRTQVIGYTSELSSQTLYTHFAVLEAEALTTGEPSGKQVWKTTVRLIDPSNDLRRLLPYMATAAAPYVASNTGSMQTVELKPDDPRVQHP